MSRLGDILFLLPWPTNLTSRGPYYVFTQDFFDLVPWIFYLKEMLYFIKKPIRRAIVDIDHNDGTYANILIVKASQVKIWCSAQSCLTITILVCPVDSTKNWVFLMAVQASFPKELDFLSIPRLDCLPRNAQSFYNP